MWGLDIYVNPVLFLFPIFYPFLTFFFHLPLLPIAPLASLISIFLPLYSNFLCISNHIPFPCLPPFFSTPLQFFFLPNSFFIPLTFFPTFFFVLFVSLSLLSLFPSPSRCLLSNYLFILSIPSLFLTVSFFVSPFLHFSLIFPSLPDHFTNFLTISLSLPFSPYIFFLLLLSLDVFFPSVRVS